MHCYATIFIHRLDKKSLRIFDQIIVTLGITIKFALYCMLIS